LFLGNRTSTSYWEEKKKKNKGEKNQNERRTGEKELEKNWRKEKKTKHQACYKK